jgi:hypothetical protein
MTLKPQKDKGLNMSLNIPEDVFKAFKVNADPLDRHGGTGWPHCPVSRSITRAWRGNSRIWFRKHLCEVQRPRLRKT